MILIRRGYGALVLVALVIAALVMNIVTNALFDNEYYGANVWPKLGTFWLAGLLSFGLGMFLRRRPAQVSADRDWYAGESAHHFFFIPVTYWAGVYFLLGIAYVAYKLTIGSSM